MSDEKLSAEYLQDWERRLGPEKVQRSIDYMAANGWGPNDTPPMWCWALAYRMIEDGEPLPVPVRAEGNLLLRLFGNPF